MDSDLHNTDVEVHGPARAPFPGAMAVPSIELVVRPAPIPVPTVPAPSMPVSVAPPPVVPVGVPAGTGPTPTFPGPGGPSGVGPPGPTNEVVAPRPEPVSGPSRGRWWLEWIAVFVVAVVLALGVRAYVAQMFYIPSGSMLPTLQVGDRIVVDKVSYHLHGVHRGDIVVFRRPPLEHDPYSDLVKRVIGLPGDTVSSVDGRVYIDGKPLAEPWLPTPEPVTSPSPVAQGFSLLHPYTVPAGEYFVMGDNRTNSEDSRYFGPIPANLIVGRMAFVAWPLDDSGWLAVLVAVAAVLVVALAVLAVQGRSRGHRHAIPARAPPLVGTP